MNINESEMLSLLDMYFGQAKTPGQQDSHKGGVVSPSTYTFYVQANSTDYVQQLQTKQY